LTKYSTLIVENLNNHKYYKDFMARYTGAKLRITRRLGDLPGLTSKKAKRSQRPGQHGATQKKFNTVRDSSRRKTETSL
jgi:hypothetical protein